MAWGVGARSTVLARAKRQNAQLVEPRVSVLRALYLVRNAQLPDENVLYEL